MGSVAIRRPDPAIRLLSAGAGLVHSAVLLDSGLEHYRGSFRNPAMLLPLATSTVNIAIDGTRLVTGCSTPDSSLRVAGQGGAVAVGLIGMGFHLFNIGKRPSGFGWGNLFHAAPLGAPAALVLAGALGAAADRAHASIISDGRAVGALCAAGIVGTAAEAALLHFRGAFQNPAMWLPVAVPPIAAAALAANAVVRRAQPTTAALLIVTAALGFAGAAFHAYGVSRRMGGWRNWRQNILAGPPLPAPAAFTGLAVAGLGALILIGRVRG
ncbi:hypothetical protein L288_12735 [Sphingobium quisquiliarum P25]|uniref:Uncharacterized protein n=1 Tax=Sphingobium quisquiliarum P25 TaxID=1329909 RepID=T0I1G3_9SPHN|nr:hypothetical protein [Sphingobium quisquiliarum]EQB05505.1 hypothetical protein L288_12735 [Sphingobium quisquiliarum P25]EZP71653.1 hypothetical protein BV96_02390 [Sphingomonas paucimobilis]